MPTYVSSGAWGSGTGAPLTVAQFDGNTYEFDTRITALETSPVAGNGIASITASGFAWTVTLDDGQSNTLPIPVLMFRWRDEWAALTLYSELDSFSVDGAGLYVTLRDHTSAATFDPEAVGPAETAGTFDIGRTYVIATVGTTDFTAIGAASSTVGVEFRATGLGSGTGTATPKTYRQLIGAGSNTNVSDLADVSDDAPTLGDVLTWAGSPPQWTPVAPGGVDALDDLTDVDVTGAGANAFLIAVSSGSPPVISWEDRTPTQATALLDDFVGDTGSPGVGGIKGLVPAPADGDAAAGKYLDAGGTWSAVTSGINELTGDVTAGPGTGSQAATLANTAVVPGSYTLASLTVDAKGRLTNASSGTGDAISDLPLATLPLRSGDLLEISETDSGSPATYTSKHIRIPDLKLTLGSTEIALGSDTDTIAGLTLSGGTLSGTTTLPGSGAVSSAGLLGIGVTPGAWLDFGATLSSTPASTTDGVLMRARGVTHTDPTGSGAVANRVAYSFGAPTFASASAQTLDGAITVYIAGPPVAGTNTTISSAASLAIGSGNVGIGTTSPAVKLHVDGSSVWIANGAGGGLGVSAGKGLRQYYDTSGDYAVIFAYDYSSGNAKNLILQSPGGNVGIGTTTPGSALTLGAGKALAFQAGTGARAGDATLVAGTVTVTNTTVTANTQVLLSRKTIGGTAGNLSYTLSAGANFTINSSSGTDTSTVTYMLVEVN